MKYQWKAMSQQEAEMIANEWKYDGIYSFYNADADPEDYEELISPAYRKNYYSATDGDGNLCGYLTYTMTGTCADIGLGMAPPLTGQGNGQQFLRDCVDVVQSNEDALTKLSLSVATFNKRAMNVYLKEGFNLVSTKQVETNGGCYEFIVMERML